MRIIPDKKVVPQYKSYGDKIRAGEAPILNPLHIDSPYAHLTQEELDTMCQKIQDLLENRFK